MPEVLIIAGPNGAGKTTWSRRIAAHLTYVDHDAIVRQVAAELGLPGAADTTRVQAIAARRTLTTLRELADQRTDFAYETTLSSSNVLRWISHWAAAGFDVSLTYIALMSREESVRRVALRVQAGGHGVPTAVVGRRWRRSLTNAFIAIDCVNTWRFIDTSDSPGVLVASGSAVGVRVERSDLWAYYSGIAREGGDVDDH